ncbi:phosphoglycerate mutase family protein [Moraxella nasovis]|uniref:histidine phosphatase family protein n=1 Tax=Moraxella nasovis TaxID=2904121 RepID=UPI001F600CE8|nr:histidine phosphatase family protein [Moraxella nasovis]UNU72670.1 phosphoglycerate mutase family protein [Moraxella nasovis]
MKKFYLIRHAQSETNAGLAIRPNHAINLTKLGNLQALELAQWLKNTIKEPISDVFVSSYVRTQQTAKPFLGIIDKEAIVIDELHEFNYLDFDRIKDLTVHEMVRLADEFWTTNVNHKDSDATESFLQFIERVRWVRNFFRSLPDGNYVVFTHGMWIGMLIWQILHQDGPRMHNMAKFRAFELAIRPKNCEVFILTGDSITKAYTKNDRQDGDIR